MKRFAQTIALAVLAVALAPAAAVAGQGKHVVKREVTSVVKRPRVSKTFATGRARMVVKQSRRSVIKAEPARPSFGQLAGLHGTSDDLMQIHLSGKELTVKYADGKKKVSLDDDYQLGTRFKVKIESSDGHVKVWYNGQQRADLPISTSTSYFKAGAYVNSNTSKGEKSAAEGQVVIYNVDVKHS